MKWFAIALVVWAGTSAAAQDSSFTQLRIRGSVFRNPVAGHIDDDWKAKTGAQVEIATNVARSEVGLAVGRLGYTPTTSKPPFTGTMFTLAWTTPVIQGRRAALSLGVRLTDMRMDFDDPSLVGGLRTEEEVMLGAITRARFRLTDRIAGFVDGSYGVLMLSTKTPMVLVHAGAELSFHAPGWLRGFLR